MIRKSGGQFAPAGGGQFAPARGGQFDRHLQSGLINTFMDCHVVLEASSGPELLNGLSLAKEAPNLCILNYFLPGITSTDAILYIKEHWPLMKILVISDNQNSYLKSLAVKAGANGYILNSCSADELEFSIQSLYNTGMLRDTTKNRQERKESEKFLTKSLEFTSNEITLLKYACSDLSYTQIADKMGTTMHSVDWYRNSLFKKLEVKSRSSLVMFAIQIGLVNPVLGG